MVTSISCMAMEHVGISLKVSKHAFKEVWKATEPRGFWNPFNEEIIDRYEWKIQKKLVVRRCIFLF